MAYSFNGTSQYISAGSAVLTGPPLTMAAWFNPNNNTAAQVISSLGASANTTDGIMLFAAGSTGGKPVAMRTGSVNQGATTTGFSASVWQHGAGATSSATSRDAWLNGGGKGSNTTNTSVANLDRTSIGVQLRSTLVGYFNGLIAEVGIWNAALTDAEIASLSKGFKPHRVRPQSLVFYAPLIRELRDWSRAISLTNNGTAIVANHPRVY